MALSLLAHLALIAALLTAKLGARPPETPAAGAATITLALIPAPSPKALQPARSAQAPVERAAPPAPPPRRSLVRRTPPRASPIVLAAADKSAPATSDGVSDAELAGAHTAGGGGGEGGDGCDMAKRLQTALRQDGLVRAAIANTRETRAIRVWNGDWIQGRGEDGKGLAAVREAIIWAIAFAPKPCQAEAVHGLVSLSLDDFGGARLVMGGGAWRWSDLLTAKGGLQSGR